MGGCRCTYRNCSLRSDGQTHMFHYPVFEKVRCHQWLKNAGRLDFLNLKVSQLKNRVVCQHHFKEDNFMNYMRDKLRFDAVPTEPGPYCDISKVPEEPSQFDNEKDCILEDIENCLYTAKDKLANFSVKYSDFLTSSELPIANLITTKVAPFEYEYNDYETKLPMINNLGGRSTRSSSKIVEQQRSLLIPPETIDCNPQTLGKSNTQTQIILKNKTLNNDKGVSKSGKSTECYKRKFDSEPKVQIISEEKISAPVAFKGKLEPVSPSSIIHIPPKKELHNVIKRVEMQEQAVVEDRIKMEKPETLDIFTDKLNNHSKVIIQLEDDTEMKNISANPLQQQKKYIDSNIQKHDENQHVILNTESCGERQKRMRGPMISNNNTQNRITLMSSPNSVVVKNKISPERIAAIEAKRKFNMKLRDIIESCFNNGNVKANDGVKKQNELQPKIVQNKGVPSYLSEDPDLPSSQEYMMSFLEARIKRMEDTLLNRISENTKQISDLKKSFHSAISEQSSISTQTMVNEESHKKYLYKEISKYLSPEANSQIYEELFINKYAQKLPKVHQSSPKRRKVR